MQPVVALVRRAWTRAGRSLAAFVCGVVVATPPVAAQVGGPPTVVWTKHWIQSPAIWSRTGISFYPLPEYYQTLYRLSPTRYALLGSHNLRDTTTARWSVTAYLPSLTMLTLAGDTVRRQTYPQSIPYRLRELRYAIPAHQAGRFLVAGSYDVNYYWFPSSSAYTRDSTGFQLGELDTLGNVRLHYYRPDPGFWASPEWFDVKNQPVVDLPDGRLALFGERIGVSTGAVNNDVVAVRVDRGGRERRRWSSGWYHSDYLRTIRLMPDGSYLAVGAIGGHDPPRLPGQPAGSPLNYWLVRFSARGDTLRSAHFGVPGGLETAHDVRPTPDGGYLLTGWRTAADQQADPTDQGRNAEVVKLDSLWHEQWHYYFKGFPQFGQNADVTSAQPTSDGGCVVLGWRTPDGYDTVQTVMRRLNAAGQLVWQKVLGPVPGSAFQVASFPDWVYEADGTALVFARTAKVLTRPSGDYWQWGTLLTKLSGLPTPWEPDFCARPPAAPAAAITPITPVEVGFVGDSTTPAGPRYAVLSLCTWDYGDGSPVDTGWVKVHTYASSQPVRVRQCVINNLWCQTCTEHFPLGPVGVGEELAASVSIYPNPSATGAFTLRAPTGATYVVLDATGRTVAAGTATGPETPLDLRAHATGVYALRLTWPDGRSLTRRLVRQ